MYCKKCGTLLSYCARFTGKRLFLLITKQVKKTYAVPTCVLCEFFRLFGPTFDTHRLPEKSSFIINKSNGLFFFRVPDLLRIPFKSPWSSHDPSKKSKKVPEKKHVTTCSRVLSHFEIWDRSIFDHPRWDVWIHCTFVPCVETAMTDCKQNGLSFRMFQCMSYT